MGDPERDEFAQSLGIHKNTLAYYERGDRTPDATALAAYHRQFDVDTNWLVTGEGAMFYTPRHVIKTVTAGMGDISTNQQTIYDPAAGTGAFLISAERHLQPRSSEDKPSDAETSSDDPRRVRPSEMIAIPRYEDVRPSAGPGALAVDETPSTRVAFEQRWLIDIGVRPDTAVILPAHGDSMEPTIRNGSLMVVDTSKTEVQNGCIYVIAVGDDLLVKRVHRRLDGLIDLISDNSAYPPETLAPDRLMHLRVIGRVYAAVSKF